MLAATDVSWVFVPSGEQARTGVLGNRIRLALGLAGLAVLGEHEQPEGLVVEVSYIQIKRQCAPGLLECQPR